jgi:Ca2+-binding EF-hand superfamily protein
MNIVTAMNKMGREITQEELDEIMDEHDIQKNGVITYLEFKALFLDLEDLDLANRTQLKSPSLGETAQ